MPRLARWLNCPRGVSGVYLIRNTETKREYIGSSGMVRVRLLAHFAELRRHEHTSYLMQADWDSYGPDSFTFEVLEVAPAVAWVGNPPHPTEPLLPIEARYIQQRQPAYNTRLTFDDGPAHLVPAPEE